MLTPDYIRETILLARQWDPEYAKTMLERVKVTVPWLMKEPEPVDLALARTPAHLERTA